MSAAASSFTAKQLRATITLANAGATFAGTNSNVLQVTGLRMISTVLAAARATINMELKIFGLLPQDMNALTMLFFNPPLLTLNTVLLEANSGYGWNQVYEGWIHEAQPDYTAPPNAFFRILSNLSYAAQVTPVAPSSFPSNVSVATLVQNLAQQMGFAFENNGVTATLRSPYYPGTAYDQLQAICQATDTDFYFAGKVLAICPSGLGRPNVPTTVLNAQSGLIGYPVLERFGITIQALFNPNFQLGGQVQVTGSDIPAANGLWSPIKYQHNLESVNPNGAWMTTLNCGKWNTAQADISQ